MSSEPPASATNSVTLQVSPSYTSPWNANPYDTSPVSTSFAAVSRTSSHDPGTCRECFASRSFRYRKNDSSMYSGNM